MYVCMYIRSSCSQPEGQVERLPDRQIIVTEETIIVSEEAVLTQTLALLPPLLIIGRIPKCFDTAVLTFLISSSEPQITYTCCAIQ